MNKATQVMVGGGRKTERKETDNEQQKEKSQEISHFRFSLLCQRQNNKGGTNKKCTGGGG